MAKWEMKIDQDGIISQRHKEATVEEIGNHHWRDNWEMALTHVSPEASAVYKGG